MDINAVSDETLSYLNTKNARNYRNSTPENPVFPYLVYTLSSVSQDLPSENILLNINIYDDVNASVTAIENIADLIDGDNDILNPSGLNNKIINTNALNLYFMREIRQFAQATELVSAQCINLRYMIRAYFK